MNAVFIHNSRTIRCISPLMANITNEIDRMSITDLEALIEAEACESVTLEFKATPYGPDHTGKSEFLKDISGMANTVGGVLFIGLAETDGVASALVPIQNVSYDDMKLRLENLLQSGIEPRISGIRMAAIPVHGNYVLAIRVPKVLIPRIASQTAVQIDFIFEALPMSTKRVTTRCAPCSCKRHR
jgi:predicted HTH transcriptional regulator